MLGVLACAAAVLLAVAGAAKARTPDPAARMLLRSVPIPLCWRRSVTGAVRLAGLAEVAVAVAAVTWGGRVTMALLALAYLALAVLAARMLRRGRGSSCGCFGATDSPIGPAHLILDVAAASVAALAVARPPGALAGLTGASGTVAATALLQACLLAALAYLSITSLPAMLAARRRLESR